MRLWAVLFSAATAACVIAACGSDTGVVTGPGPDTDGSAGGVDGNVDGGGQIIIGNDSGLTGDTGTGSCKAKTCAQQGANCGPLGDGCGNLLDCGACTAPQTCGGGGVSSQCGGVAQCVPKTCATAGADCGPVADGCGGLLQCGTCVAPKTCGGGGTPSVCGGVAACVPKTCAQLNATCGPQADGCGVLLDCGTCTPPQTCGGGGVNSQCGGGPVDAGADAGGGCVPKTCVQLGASCGPAGDGCGGTLQCGVCTAPQTCGGGGTPSVCGGGCVPKTCAGLGINCGAAGDGCGGTLQCGVCTAPQTCGGGGTPSVCGGSVCVPKTCAQQNFNCGQNGDGCGGTISCGTCAAPEYCGGGGTSRCGLGFGDGGVVFGSCDGGAVTTVTGTVFAGTDPARFFGNPDPIYNALVYIPASPITPFPTNGVVCEQCGAASGNPIVLDVTGPDGKFTLRNAPLGPQLLVVQLGHWRRQIAINVTGCTNNALPNGTVRLPRNKTDGFGGKADIPLMALATGNVDSLECVLRKMGVEDSEFTNPAGTGRVRLYVDNGTTIAGAGTFATLLGTAVTGPTELDKYDIVMLPCRGGESLRGGAQQKNMVTYAGNGGRIFATHFSYVWFLNNNAPGYVNPFFSTAPWNPDPGVNNPPPDPLTGIINTTTPGFQKGKDFAQWLVNVGSSTTYGQVTLNVTRHDVDFPLAAGSTTQEWIESGVTSPATLQHLTFNTPVGVPAAQQCGRALFSDFHVSNNATNGTTFPNGCPVATAGNPQPLTPQEKVLEFMLFDLASCVTPPACVPKTCAQLGISCGPAGDGCGNLVQCGTCTPPQTCGGGGTPGACGNPPCTPRTCAQLGVSCGAAGDGCGGTLQCGTCTPPQTCGGGGTPGVCGGCVPKTCAQLGVSCGPAADGCGNLLQCGTCTAPATCGGGGPGQCGIQDAGFCTPLTCAGQGYNCGAAGDGCGNVIQCGTCSPPNTCGGGGTPGVCGAPSCTPRTCAQLGYNCGPAGDGCGNTLNCGTCTPPNTCGGGGTPGVCGAPSCTPKTCAQLGFNCGPAGDGCGGQLNCGVCISPQTCGGGGVAGVCGGGIH